MPPAQQPSGGQQGGDNSLAPFWIMCLVFGLIWAAWHFGHQQIATIILHIKLIEAEFIGLFISSAGPLIADIRHTSAATVDFSTLANMSVGVGDYLRYPVGVLLVIFAVVIYMGKATSRYKKTYNMGRLVTEETVSWPQITPVAKVDLVHTNIHQGPWAMALTPMQFAKKHRLLQEERILVSDPVTMLQSPKVVVSLRRDETYQVFSLQLGRYWTGIEHLNPHTKALFAVFAAREGRDQDGAKKLLMHIASSAATGKLDFSGTNELLEKHKNNKKIIQLTQNYAFVLTVMASMLLLAREDGVLASADFLWLKPIDRPLWFMLNSVGRQTPFVEVAGPFAHWLAEQKFGQKLSVPMIDEAVNALEGAIKEVIYVPDTQ